MIELRVGVETCATKHRFQQKMVMYGGMFLKGRTSARERNGGRSCTRAPKDPSRAQGCCIARPDPQRPVAGLVPQATHGGAKVMIINREPTPYDQLAELVIHAQLGPVMELLQRELGLEREAERDCPRPPLPLYRSRFDLSSGGQRGEFDRRGRVVYYRIEGWSGSCVVKQQLLRRAEAFPRRKDAGSARNREGSHIRLAKGPSPNLRTLCCKA